MIRKAELKDIPLIQAMAEVVFRQTYKELISPAQMDYMMDWMYSSEGLTEQMSVRGDVFFIEEGAGYVSVRPDGVTAEGFPLFHLEKLYVLPALQGTGLGKKLFEKVAEYVRTMSKGPARIELNVNRGNSAVSFYEHLGMRKARSGDFDIGNGFFMNDYIMSIDL